MICPKPLHEFDFDTKEKQYFLIPRAKCTFGIIMRQNKPRLFLPYFKNSLLFEAMKKLGEKIWKEKSLTLSTPNFRMEIIEILNNFMIPDISNIIINYDSLPRKRLIDGFWLKMPIKDYQKEGELSDFCEDIIIQHIGTKIDDAGILTLGFKIVAIDG